MVLGLGKPNIEKMMTKRDIDGLIEALGYKDPQIAWNAMLALIRLGPPSVEPLAAKMQNIDNNNISYLPNKLIVVALGQLGYHGAIPLLRTCSKDSIQVISKFSALSLGQFGDTYALRPLCDILKNQEEEPNIRLAALEMLKHYPDDDALFSIMDAARQQRVLGDNTVKDKAIEFVNFKKTEIIQILLQKLNGPQKKDVADTLSWLGWIPQTNEDKLEYYVTREEWDKCAEIGTSAVGTLVKALENKDSEVQLQAIGDALIKIGEPAVEPLIEILEMNKYGEDTAEALNKIGWKQPIENFDTGSKKKAIDVLGNIGDPRAVEPLITSLKSDNKDLREKTIGALVKIGDPAIESIISLLKDENKEMRELAVNSLDETGWKPSNDELGAYYWIIKGNFDKAVDIGQPAVGILLELLKDENSEIQSNAAKTLGKIGDIRAVEPLIQALKDVDREVQNNAAVSLVKIGEPAVEPLTNALNDENPSVRNVVAIVLGEVGDPHSVKPLLNALKDGDSTVRKSSADALEKIGWNPGKDEIGADYWITKGEIDKTVEIGEPAVKPLINILENENPKIRSNVATVLGEIGDLRSVEPLIKAIEDEDQDVQNNTIMALGKIGDSKAVEPLINALKNENAGIKINIIRSLGEIGDQNSIEILIDGLNDKDLSVQDASAKALEKIGEPTVEALLKILKYRYKKLEIKKIAIQILDKIGWEPSDDDIGIYYWIMKGKFFRTAQIGESAINPLIKILRDEDEYLQKNAAKALVRIGEPAVKPLINILENGNSSVRNIAANALGNIGDSHAIEPLSKALEDEDEILQIKAVNALKRIDDPSTLPIIESYEIKKREAQKKTETIDKHIKELKDENGDVRKRAALSLGRIGDSRAVEPLMESFNLIIGIDDETAVKALGEIGDPRAVDVLIRASYKSPDLREIVVEYIGKIGEPAVEPLMKKLSYYNETVEMAFVEIGEPAVKPLIGNLLGGRWEARVNAARALIELYRSDKLNDEQKQLILRQQLKIEKKHKDYDGHTDHLYDGIYHTDKGSYVDNGGIGIEFDIR